MINFKLKDLLEARGYTQIELSRKIGARPTTISAICNNVIKELPISLLEKICDFLDCEPGDLIEKIPPQNLDKRRTLISRDYSMPTTTKEERIKMANDALALSTLEAPEPTRFTQQLTDQFIDGQILEEDMLKMTLERYQM